MASISSFFTSTIGKKVVMALTGLALFLFVIGHLAGNLQVFLGQEVFNAYAAFLKGLGPMLWVLRGGLLLVFVLHVATAYSLSRVNAQARPEAYRSKNTVQASAASLYMLQSGTVILIFVIIHLLHFTLGVLQPEHFSLVDVEGRHDVYSMLIRGFENVPYAAGYIVAMCFLGLHLSHAIASLFQTLGINHPRYTSGLQKVSKALGILVALGYLAIPIAVLFGVLQLPQGRL